MRPHPQQHHLVAALDLGPLGQGGAQLDGRSCAGCPAGSRGPRPERVVDGRHHQIGLVARSARGGGSRSGPAARRTRPRGCGPASGTWPTARVGPDGRLPGGRAGSPGCRVDMAEAPVAPAPAHVERPPGPRVDQQVDVDGQLGRRPREGTTPRAPTASTAVGTGSGATGRRRPARSDVAAATSAGVVPTGIGRPVTTVAPATGHRPTPIGRPPAVAHGSSPAAGASGTAGGAVHARRPTTPGRAR